MLGDASVVAGRRAPRSRRGWRTRATPRSGSRRCSGCTDSASRRVHSRARTAPRRPGGTPREGRGSHAEGRAGDTFRAQRSPPQASSKRARRRARPDRATTVASRPPPAAAAQSATALSTPPLIATAVRCPGSARKIGPERVRECVDRERLAADGAASNSVSPARDRSSPDASASTIRSPSTSRRTAAHSPSRVESPKVSIIGHGSATRSPEAPPSEIHPADRSELCEPGEPGGCHAVPRQKPQFGRRLPSCRRWFYI